MLKRMVKFLLCQVRRIQLRKQCAIDPLAIVRGKVFFVGANKVGANSCVVSSKFGYGTYMGRDNLFPNCRFGRYCSMGNLFVAIDELLEREGVIHEGM